MDGAEALSRKFAVLPQSINDEAMKKALFKGAAALEREVRKEIKNKHLILTGAYRTSVTAESVDKDEAAVYTVQAYARIHEFGGTITAKHAPFLVFSIGRGKNQIWVRTKSVRMPARPHWRPAIASGKKKIIDSISLALFQHHKRFAAR